MRRKLEQRSGSTAKIAATNLFVRVELASGLRIGPGKIALLEAIRAKGSITAAARAIGRSYRWAWLLVEEINQGLEAPAVAAAHGGRRGGGAVVTPAGERIVNLYHAIEAQARSAVGQELQALELLTRRTNRSSNEGANSGRPPAASSSVIKHKGRDYRMRGVIAAVVFIAIVSLEVFLFGVGAAQAQRIPAADMSTGDGGPIQADQYGPPLRWYPSPGPTRKPLISDKHNRDGAPERGLASHSHRRTLMSPN